MSDLTEIQSSQSIKLAGADPATGVESFWTQVDSHGTVQSGLYTPAGSAIDLNFGAASSTTIRVAALLGNASGAVDFNYGSASAQTIRTASHIGNATGAAAFGAGLTNAQVLRVVLPTDQTAIPSSQSGTWTVQPGNTANSTPWLVTDSSDGSVGAGAAATKSSLSGLVFNTALPTLTAGQQSAIQGDSSGRLIISPLTNSSVTKVQLQDNAGTAITLGQKVMASSVPVVIASDQSSVPVTNASDGPVTPGTVAGKSILIGGQYNSTLPTLTTGQQSAIQTDANGRILVSSSPLPTTSSKFSFGDIITAATATVPVERTSYTEQSTNVAMTLVSSNANDTAAGTGARTVQVTYLDNTMSGPLTTTFAMNGTTPVTAGVSNMCYIEKIQVLTVGSGGLNAGILTLKSGATTVGTVSVGDLQTFWAHHYVPTGKTSYISGFSINSSSTTTGAGGNFVLRASTPTVANSPELQVSDFHRLYGQQSSTNTRTYLSPIQVVGPARIRSYVTPETTTSTAYRASFDYIDN